MKLSKEYYRIEDIEGYNFVLENGRSLPPKDIVITSQSDADP